MTRREFIRTLIGKSARPKIDVTQLDDKTLMALCTESYAQYVDAGKRQRFSKQEYYWKVFSDAKHEARYVRHLY